MRECRKDKRFIKGRKNRVMHRKKPSNAFTNKDVFQKMMVHELINTVGSDNTVNSRSIGGPK